MPDKLSNMNESILLQKLRMPSLSQIGIIVPELNEGVKYYRTLLNIKKWYRTRIRGVEYFYLDKAIDQELDIAVGYSGRIQVELIEVRGNDENIYSALLGKGGSGLHHLGFTVRNLEKKIKEMEKAGISPIQTGTLRFGRGGVTKFAYFDTLERAGFILELIETKAFGINLGMPRWLVSLGRFTGDTEAVR